MLGAATQKLMRQLRKSEATCVYDNSKPANAEIVSTRYNDEHEGIGVMCVHLTRMVVTTLCVGEDSGPYE